ncbi:MAG: leucine-rich repeat domain-containing protein [Methylococcaceae bacterium]
MSDNKNLPQKKDSAEVALQKTTSLLSITNKILANRANRTLVVSDDAWLDELIAWAVENDIPEKKFPRDKQAILALTELHLNSNKFTELPEWIGKLTNLTVLDLGGNKFTELPEWIGKLTNLTTLDLWDNQLTKLPESIGKLTNLTTLDLRGNPIKSLTAQHSHLSHLSHITKFD